jgi:hypothetical protein
VPPRRSIAYPTSHLLAVVDDPSDAARAVDAVTRSGVAKEDVTVLRGEDSAATIGGLGARHSRLTRVIRAVQYLTMDQMPDFAEYERALREGRTLIAVHVIDRVTMLGARDALVAHGAHFLNYYGRVATEELGRWREPGSDEWTEDPFPEEVRNRRR